MSSAFDSYRTRSFRKTIAKFLASVRKHSSPTIEEKRERKRERKWPQDFARPFFFSRGFLARHASQIKGKRDYL